MMPSPSDYDQRPARAAFDAAISSGSSTIFGRSALSAYDAAYTAAKAKVLIWMADLNGAIFESLLIRAMSEGCRLLVTDINQLTKLPSSDKTMAIDLLLAAVEHGRIAVGGKSVRARLGFAVDAVWQGQGPVDPAILSRFEVRVDL